MRDRVFISEWVLTPDDAPWPHRSFMLARISIRARIAMSKMRNHIREQVAQSLMESSKAK